MSKQLREQLKQLRYEQHQINPDALWVIEQKKKLLSQISNTVEVPHTPGIFHMLEQLAHVFVPKGMVRYASPVIIALIAVGVTVSGWVAGANAAYNSLPGDALYGVKLAAEKTQVAIAGVTGGKSAETHLHLEFASRRVDEVKKVLEKNDTAVTTQNVHQAIDQLKQSIEQAKQNVKDVGETNVDQAITLASDLSRKTAEISLNLKDVSIEHQDANMVKEVAQTKDIVTTAGIETVQNMVEKTAKGDTSTEVKNKVTELVASTISGLSEQSKVDTETVKKTISESATSNSASAVVSAAMSTTTGALLQTVSSTLAAQGTTSDSATLKKDVVPQVKEAVDGAVQKVDQSSVLADKVIVDAKSLVEQKDLLGALQKVKEFTKINNDAVQAVTDAKETVQKIITQQVTGVVPTTTISTPSTTTISTATSSSSTIEKKP